MSPEVRTYLEEIVNTENYLQLMKDLLLASTDSDDEKVWLKRKSFCEAEVVPNIDFVVSAAMYDMTADPRD